MPRKAKNRGNFATGKSLDDELGFRMCARLMELSFCMQMEDLGFRKCEYDWSSQAIPRSPHRRPSYRSTTKRSAL